MENFGKFVTGIILIAIDFIIMGFVLMKFWNWFVVPAIKMTAGPELMGVGVCVNPLTFAQAIGLSTFFVIFTSKIDTSSDDDFGDIVAKWFVKVIYVAVIFVLGLIIHAIIK